MTNPFHPFRGVRWTILVLGTVLLFLGSADPGIAQSAASGHYNGLDILFLVDHSGSMSGRYQGQALSYKATDPQGMRFLGPQFLLDQLGSYRLALSNSSTPEINMALIGFGDVTRPLLNWTKIDARNRADWATISAQIRDGISEARFGTDAQGFPIELGLTDFQLAFSKARDFFEMLPADPTMKHLRVIIILTDGGPCTQAIADAANCLTDPANALAVEHLTTLAAFTRQYFPQPDYALFLIGLDRDNNFYDKLIPDWSNVICAQAQCSDVQMMKVAQESDLGAQLGRVLDQVINEVAPNSVKRQELKQPYDFAVLPYTDYLAVNVFKNGVDSAQISLLVPPDGHPATAAASGTNTPIETVEVEAATASPLEPGIWKVNFGNPSLIDKVVVSTDQIQAGATLSIHSMDPNSAQSFYMFAPVVFDVQIVNEDKKALNRYCDSASGPQECVNERYPLSVFVDIYDRTTDKLVAGNVQLGNDPRAVQQAEFTGNWIPEAGGKYVVQVTAQYKDQGGATAPLFTKLTPPDNSGDFDVSDATVEYSLPQGNRYREQISFPVQALVKADSTDIPLNTSHAQLKVTIRDDKGNVVSDNTMPNESSSAGTIQVHVNSPTLLANPPGVPRNFRLSAQAGYTDAQNKFVPMGAEWTNDLDLEIRPIRLLSLSITQPTQSNVIAQMTEILPQFFPNAPITVQVELRDGSGSPVSLQSITNNTEKAPTLTLQEGSKETDVSSHLKEVSPGIYTFQTDTYGPSDLTFKAESKTPSEQLDGDFRWQTNSASFKQSRQMNPILPGILIGGAVLLVILVVGGYGGAHYWHDLTVNPLNASVQLYELDAATGRHDTLGNPIRLATYQRNHVHLTRNLPSPLILLDATTGKSAESYTNRLVTITKVRFKNGQEESVGETISPGTETVITTDIRTKEGEIVSKKYVIKNIGSASGGSTEWTF